MKTPSRNRIARGVACASLVALLLRAVPSIAASGNVSVDFASDQGTASGVASGFLHALTPKSPAQSVLDGIAIHYVRGTDHHQNLPSLFDPATYARVKTTGAQLIVGLYYGHGSYWPGDNGDDYSKWETEVQGVLDESKAHDFGVYSWISWNEPDLQWTGKSAQYKEAHRRAYERVKAWSSAARVEAPEISSFNFGFMTDFLGYCKEHDVVPDVISWHELATTPTDIEAHTLQLKNWLAQNGIAPRPFAVTEYQGSGYGASATSGYYDPGLAVAYLARLERSTNNGLELACRSNWSWTGEDTNFEADLGGLSDRATRASPTSVWWVYAAYSQMSGRKVQTTQPSGLEAFATTDAAKAEARALVGNWSDSTGYDLTLELDHLPSYVMSGASVRVQAWSVSQTVGTPLTSMTAVQDATLTPDAGTLKFSASLAKDSALIVQLGPGAGGGSGGSAGLSAGGSGSEGGSSDAGASVGGGGSAGSGSQPSGGRAGAVSDSGRAGNGEPSGIAGSSAPVGGSGASDDMTAVASTPAATARDTGGCGCRMGGGQLAEQATFGFIAALWLRSFRRRSRRSSQRGAPP